MKFCSCICTYITGFVLARTSMCVCKCVCVCVCVCVCLSSYWYVWIFLFVWRRVFLCVWFFCVYVLNVCARVCACMCVWSWCRQERSGTPRSSSNMHMTLRSCMLATCFCAHTGTKRGPGKWRVRYAFPQCRGNAHLSSFWRVLIPSNRPSTEESFVRYECSSFWMSPSCWFWFCCGQPKHA